MSCWAIALFRGRFRHLQSCEFSLLLLTAKKVILPPFFLYVRQFLSLLPSILRRTLLPVNKLGACRSAVSSPSGPAMTSRRHGGSLQICNWFSDCRVAVNGWTYYSLKLVLDKTESARWRYTVVTVAAVPIVCLWNLVIEKQWHPLCWGCAKQCVY